MEKHVSVTGTTKGYGNFYQQELEDLQGHITNFDNLIQDIKQKLKRRSDETLNNKASVYQVNIDDLESGLEIWNEKCQQVENYYRECLSERKTISKAIENLTADIEHLRRIHSDTTNESLNLQQEKITVKPQTKQKIVLEQSSHKTQAVQKSQPLVSLDVGETLDLKHTDESVQENKTQTEQTTNTEIRNEDICVQNIADGIPGSLNFSNSPGRVTEYATGIETDTLVEKLENVNIDNSQLQNAYRLSVPPRPVVNVEVPLHNDHQYADLHRWNTHPNVIPNNAIILGYCPVTKNNASTQTDSLSLDGRQYISPGENDNQTLQHLQMTSPTIYIREKQLPALPHFSSNIYQTVASNDLHTTPEPSKNKYSLRIKNKSKGYMYPKGNYDNGEDINNLASRQHWQSSGVESPSLVPAREWEQDIQNNYNAQTYYKQDINAFHADTPTKHVKKRLLKKGNASEKLPFSFGGDKGWYKFKGNTNVTAIEHISSDSVTSGCITEQSQHEIYPRRPKADKRMENDLYEAKETSEFHRSCTTPITVRIIQRLEKDKQKRLSPISYKRVSTRKYPISPKYRKPRTYVSAFHRKMQAMAYNA